MNRTSILSSRTSRGVLRLALIAAILASAAPAWAQKFFPTPDAAAAAFVDSLARHDNDALKSVLGPQYAKYVPVGGVDPEDVTNFLEAWAKAHRIMRAGDTKAYLEVGTRGWTLPIPLEKTAAGWRFETQQTQDELRTRRIGRNELNVIQVLLAYTDAQNDYAANDRDRDGVKQYAQKIISSPGKRDGLYWPTVYGEAPSPLGPIVTDAKTDQTYHGYRYRVLKAQGSSAAGGTKSYVRDGRMTGGYALVAWPTKFGDTGVMTFIVNQDGVVFQKDLGPNTDAIARAMTAYDPGAGWTRASPAK